MIRIVCSTCGNSFDSDRRLRKYCSLKCAAISNNKLFPKKKYSHYYCKCGRKMSPKAKQCVNCRVKENFYKFHEKTLRETQNKKWGIAAQWNDVRWWARRAMEIWKIPKKCFRCNWDNHVEVSHKKSIKSFPLETKIKEVNSKENLEYHCPNCHWLYEHGIIG